jgi:hypothetical protein
MHGTVQSFVAYHITPPYRGWKMLLSVIDYEPTEDERGQPISVWHQNFTHWKRVTFGAPLPRDEPLVQPHHCNDLLPLQRLYEFEDVFFQVTAPLYKMIPEAPRSAIYLRIRSGKEILATYTALLGGSSSMIVPEHLQFGEGPAPGSEPENGGAHLVSFSREELAERGVKLPR